MGEKFKATRDWHLSLAHCAIFCMWPSSTCSQGGCCTFRHHVQEHQEEGGQVGKRQKVPAPESMPFNNFPWKPNSAYILFARTVPWLHSRLGK